MARQAVARKCAARVWRRLSEKQHVVHQKAVARSVVVVCGGGGIVTNSTVVVRGLPHSSPAHVIICAGMRDRAG